MIVILEGLDRTGKTTLANAIADRLDCPVIHKSAPKSDDALTEYLAPFAGYASDSDLVLDRWHWGEAVWPGVYGRRSIMDVRQFVYVEKILARLGAGVVYCTGDSFNVWNRIQENDEPLAQLPLPVTAFEGAWNAFEAVAERSILPVTRYDFELIDRDTAVASIVAQGYGRDRLLRSEADVA